MLEKRKICPFQRCLVFWIWRS